MAPEHIEILGLQDKIEGLQTTLRKLLSSKGSEGNDSNLFIFAAFCSLPIDTISEEQCGCLPRPQRHGGNRQ